MKVGSVEIGVREWWGQESEDDKQGLVLKLLTTLELARYPGVSSSFHWITAVILSGFMYPLLLPFNLTHSQHTRKRSLKRSPLLKTLQWLFIALRIKS